MRRRELLDWLAVSAAMASLPAAGGCDPSDEVTADDAEPPTLREQATLHIGMLVYPSFTALDLIGPQTIFAQMSNTQVHLVWKTLDPVTSDSGITITPTRTFESCPQNLDVLFVPGGTSGTVAMMEDLAVLAFLRDRAATSPPPSSTGTAPPRGSSSC